MPFEALSSTGTLIIVAFKVLRVTIHFIHRQDHRWVLQVLQAVLELIEGII
jgi:hypothetical protein